MTSAVFSDADGEARSCLILRDVTAQRAEEAALRASEQLLRRLIATSNDAFVAMDAAGRITEWNHQAEVIFGWNRQEAIGRRMVDTIIPPRYREAHTQGLAHYLITGDGPVLGQRLETQRSSPASSVSSGGFSINFGRVFGFLGGVAGTAGGIWVAGKVLSPGCGQLLPACALVL